MILRYHFISMYKRSVPGGATLRVNGSGGSVGGRSSNQRVHHLTTTFFTLYVEVSFCMVLNSKQPLLAALSVCVCVSKVLNVASIAKHLDWSCQSRNSKSKYAPFTEGEEFE